MRPMTPADCCLSKCQYSLQKTDLRQSEFGLLRGEEHRGLHRPGGDGADVCSQVRDWGDPLIWRCRVIRQVRPQQLASVLPRKNREKSREIKFLSQIREEAGIEFSIFEIRLKYEQFQMLNILNCFLSGPCPATPRCPSATRRRTRRSTGPSLARAGRTEARL